VTEHVLALLRADELGRVEQTCRYFSGALDRSVQERLRRTVRCKALRAISANPSAPASVRAMQPHIAQYCSDATIRYCSDALQRLVTACAPALLEMGKHDHYYFSGALFQVSRGMPSAQREGFMRVFLATRAEWLATLSSEERSDLQDIYALPNELRVCLRIAREQRGVLSNGALLTILRTLSERARFNDEDFLEDDDERSVGEWASAFDKLRELAGADIEVLHTLHKHKTDREWYAPFEPEFAEMCCEVIQNVFRSSRHTLGMSPLREPMHRHLLGFHSIFSTGPNAFPRYAPDVNIRAVLRKQRSITAEWRSMLTSPRAREWLKESERWGFALHLRAHQLLHDMFDSQGVEIDYWSFQALLVTQTLMRGALVMARQFETVDGLSAFLEDLFAMVSAYRVAVPVTQKWYERIMAQHRMMHR
jgi:hypothetical protein